MISFKSAHFPKNIILRAVFFYVRHALSYRGPEEILEKRSVKVDHATLNRWFVRNSSSLAVAANNRKRTVATSWRMEETYIKTRGE